MLTLDVKAKQEQTRRSTTGHLTVDEGLMAGNCTKRGCFSHRQRNLECAAIFNLPRQYETLALQLPMNADHLESHVSDLTRRQVATTTRHSDARHVVGVSGQEVLTL